MPPKVESGAAKHPGKSHKSQKRDGVKHSSKLHNKNLGQPAKGGAGGKGTWGVPGVEYGAEHDRLDVKDPNYDPMDAAYLSLAPPETSRKKFAASIQDLNKFKDAVSKATRDWIASNDARDFQRVVASLDSRIFHQDISSVVLKTTLDKLQDETIRQRVIVLLHGLVDAQLVTPTQMMAGFRKLYNRLEDLNMDVPNAAAVLAPVLESVSKRGLVPQKDAYALKESVRLLADGPAVTAAKQKIAQIVSDYFTSEDVKEARQAVAELKAPHLHFELVKKVVSAALDRGNRERELASCLLGALADGVITEDEVAKAFTILLERVEDTFLDVPDILKLLSIFLSRAVADECLPPSFLVRVDLQAGDMGYQVVSQASHLLKQEKARLRLARAWGVRTKASQFTEEDEEEFRQLAAAAAKQRKADEAKAKGDAWDLPSPKVKSKAPTAAAAAAVSAAPKAKKAKRRSRGGVGRKPVSLLSSGTGTDDEEESREEGTEEMSISKKRRIRRKRAQAAKAAANGSA